MSTLERRGFRLGFATLALFTGIAGDFWRDATSWYGWGVVIAVVVAGSIVLVVRQRRRFRWSTLPYPLLAFLVLATLSISWSFYPLFTVGGALSQWITTLGAVAIAITLSWPELLTVLGWTFRLVLGLSFLFEFVVSAVIRHPVYPVWIVPDDPAHPAKLLYWSRDLLFHAGKIQGILGNSSLLAMAALLGLIVFAVQYRVRSVGRFWGLFWMLVAAVAIGLTRSATILVGVVAVVIVLLAAIVVRHAESRRARRLTYGGIGLVAILLIAGGVLFRGPILSLLGKSSDFTGRTGIWQAVIDLARQRPAFGWGWLSYWVPTIEPFRSMNLTRGGVQVLHAHDAWLDVWLQLGILGLIVFAALVLSTVVRSWLLATDRIVTEPGSTGRFSWLALLPLLMITAQLVQSIAESRMLLEGGWMLLVIWAVKTKATPLDSETQARELLRS
ncbi:MAG TPA: O-antigen ligase family protein [Lacisediminihabitans sp.]|uniref:O-antigen ligase family protein n=1 Tax=Lacisediminihabitans sp. TaxID=2787631 RepID=UPI002EDA21D2